MRAFPTLLIVAGLALCTGALAQDQKAAPMPRAPGSATTTGVAPNLPPTQPSIRQRQPRPEALPGGGSSAPPVSPYDQEIDRNLQICRNC
jgi:hypothetical protein